MPEHIVPAARAALLDLLTARYGGPDSTVRVDHGPPRAKRDTPAAIGVAVAAQSGLVVAGDSRPRLGGQRDEAAEITVAIDVAAGNDDVASDGAAGNDSALAQCEAEAFGLLDDLHDLLHTNRRLGGAVTTAAVARYSYQPRRSPDGVGAYIEVTVGVSGRRGPQQ